MGRLTRDDIRAAFEALADELRGEPDRFEFALAGGAALVLLYDARPSTKDVDAILVGNAPRAVARAAAERVAAKRSLPADWLNDAAKGYLHGVELGPVVFQSGNVIVRALGDAQLLAMKLCAWRDDIDIADARLLLTNLAGSRDEVWGRLEPFLVPGRELKARYAFDDLWESCHEPA